jgi:hypothetical protein
VVAHHFVQVPLEEQAIHLRLHHHRIQMQCKDLTALPQVLVHQVTVEEEGVLVRQRQQIQQVMAEQGRLQLLLEFLPLMVVAVVAV